MAALFNKTEKCIATLNVEIGYIPFNKFWLCGQLELQYSLINIPKTYVIDVERIEYLCKRECFSSYAIDLPVQEATEPDHDPSSWHVRVLEPDSW